MKVTAAPRAWFRWIEERTGCVLTPNARAIAALDSDGRIRGMVAYDCWTENAVQAHMAVDSPIVWRSLAAPAFSYPFEEQGKGLLLAVIPGSNRRSVTLAKHFGFTEVASIQDGWARGVPLVTLQMRREDCRFISQHRKAA